MTFSDSTAASLEPDPEDDAACTEPWPVPTAPLLTAFDLEKDAAFTENWSVPTSPLPAEPDPFDFEGDVATARTSDCSNVSINERGQVRSQK